MKFKEFLAEKKITGIKDLIKGDKVYGSLKTLIWVKDVPKELEDETTIYTHIIFEANTWQLKNLDIPDVFERTPFKKEVKKAIDAMVSKLDTKYFDGADGEDLKVDKNAEFEIVLSKKVIK